MALTRDHYVIPELDDGLRLPYLVLTGHHPGPHLTVLAGVHGCEYAGMSALREFVRLIDHDELRGTITAVPVVNLPAFRTRTPFVGPGDKKNLNRCFPGDPAGSYSDVLAHHVFERFIRRTDYLVDVHSGDLPESLEPMVIYDESAVADAARGLALAYGVDHVVRQPAAHKAVTGTTSSAAAHADVPAIVAEAGGNGLVTEAAVRTHVTGLTNICKHLGLLPGELERPRRQLEHDAGWNWLYSPVQGWWQPSAELGRLYLPGQVLGAVTDLFGEPLYEVVAPEAGIPLFVTSSPAMEANGLLLAITRGVPV